MKEIKNVKGSQESVQNVEILGDRVLVRSNIIAVNTGNFKGWTYDEVEYTKDEYISYMGEEKQALSNDLQKAQENILSISDNLSQFMDYTLANKPTL